MLKSAMLPLASVSFLIGSFLPTPSIYPVRAAPRYAFKKDAPYEEDVRFALKEIKKHCGHFFKQKKINWKKVSTQFLKEAKRVKSDQDHLVLLVRLLARLKDGHASVRPLEKGKGIQWPNDDWKRKTGAGMFWCRIGKKIYIKNSWGPAAKAGIRPGLEVVGIGRVPIQKWIDARIEKLSDEISFSTEQQAFHYLCHWGLSELPGTKQTLVLRNLKKRKVAVTLTYGPKTSTVAQGPAFFPKKLKVEKNIKYGKTDNGYGYIHFRRCRGDLPESTDRALEAIGDVPGMILDFRGNPGGGFDHDAFLGRFIPEGKSIRFKKGYRSAGDHPYGGNVIVIVDGTVRSAGETASGIFKEDGRAFMIGESPTAGMSSSKKTIELPSELFSLYVSVYSNKKRFNGGDGIEGIGVIPHETVEFDPRDLARERDTLIRRAEELLKRFPRKKVPYDPKKFGVK